MTHICVSKLTITGSDNGLSPGRRQAIIWTNAGILLIGPLGTNFSEILSEIHTFSFKKMHLKTSSAKWRPFFSRPQCVKMLLKLVRWTDVWFILPRCTTDEKFLVFQDIKFWQMNCSILRWCWASILKGLTQMAMSITLTPANPTVALNFISIWAEWTALEPRSVMMTGLNFMNLMCFSPLTISTLPMWIGPKSLMWVHSLAPWHMVTSSNRTFSALLALCARNAHVTGEFPSQSPVTRSFDVSFDLRLNKRLS